MSQMLGWQSGAEITSRRLKRWKIVFFGIVGLCVFAIIVATITDVDEKPSRVQQSGLSITPAPIQQPEVIKAPPPAPVPDLQLWEYGLNYTEYGNKIIKGKVFNNTDRTYPYVQANFVIFDAHGAQIGSTFANIAELQPRACWKFEAGVFQDEAQTIKFTGFTGIGPKGILELLFNK